MSDANSAPVAGLGRSSGRVWTIVFISSAIVCAVICFFTRHLPAFRGLEFASPQRAYFVTIRRDAGGAALGAAGEMANVSQAFQPSARFSAANSL